MSNRLLNIEIVGARDIKGRFARVQKELTVARREELRALGRRVVGALQAEAPVRTGRLRRGIHYRTTETAGDLRIRVTSEAPYTMYVIRGRGPVVAKRAQYLRFEPGPPGSGFIYRKRVGPAKANPFHARAFAKLSSMNEPTATARRIARRVENAYTIR